MIHAHMLKSDGLLSGFELKGHAGSGEYGYDIVCAAVSVLAINTVNSLEKLAGATLNRQADEENGGLLVVKVSSSLKDSKVQLLLKSLELGLNDIEVSYHEYIHVE
ncbi:hypothetical protein SAMN05216431_10339 [Ligilactobacillus sp. WC1T17]|uniref:Ribosomal processing cysteine protease Prp n=1 Tax=Ligilactobacillus ruminis TaxID=1623 RepID=A0ABY1AA37_9LACO|nr:hypothetical protein SAMN05216431_10339 [Ligilactobacillus ruminis]